MGLLDGTNMDLAHCHGFGVAAGERRVGAIETPVFAGPSSTPDYLIVRTDAGIDGTFRLVPASLVVDVDTSRRLITLGVGRDQVEGLPQRLPSVGN
jgi:hypothetical protein